MKTLFITTNDIKDFSNLSGNIDNNKIIQFISIAQDLDVVPILGTDLSNRLIEVIEHGSLTAIEEALINDYIKPTLIHFAQSRILPNIAYTIANGGIFKHSSENSETVDVKELNVLTENEVSIASQYGDRLAKYLRFHTSDFPEYLTNTNEDIKPDRNPVFNPFELSGNKHINYRRLGGLGYGE
jgi:hypothetical protein